MTPCLAAAAVAILSTQSPRAKATASQATARTWRAGSVANVGHADPPDRPARPDRPALLPPKQMPKRRTGQTPAARVALLHALAHIELNAIDLAWDLIARFAAKDLPSDFYDDWVRVADEEAKHFLLLEDRLADFGAAYGDLPAHDGLWEAAQATADNLLARLAVVPMVLEARGLDVTPSMIRQMSKIGDTKTASILATIYEDEIGHVAIGTRWFVELCGGQGQDVAETWQMLVRRYFRGQLKPPFNREARDRAGLDPHFYEPLAAGKVSP